MKLEGEAFIQALERLRREDLISDQSSKDLVGDESNNKAGSSSHPIRDSYQEFFGVSIKMLSSINDLLKTRELSDIYRREFEEQQRIYENKVKSYLVLRTRKKLCK